MKKILTLFILLQSAFLLNAQVGINTEILNENTMLHVSEKKDENSPIVKKGIMIPRLSESERDELTYQDPQANPKVIKLTTKDNSLMIYNTTEECYNYWNHIEQEWKSLCGKLGKSIFTVNCSSITVFGTYIQGRELGTSNYIKIPVTVTKPGEYTIFITTENGYNFTASGTFLTDGEYTVIAQGQGIPQNVQIDQVEFNSNGETVTCTPPITVNVLSPAGTYTFTCRSAKANGVYKVGFELTATNTVTVPVVVTEIGSYTITTDTVDGFSFSGSGTFTSIGNHTITLYGTGIPSSTETKTFTMTSDSKGNGNKTCSFNVIITIPKKRLLTIGTSENGYGYNFAGNAASGRMIMASNNYGTTDDSVVKFEGFERINGTNAPSEANLQNWLLGTDPVDILILGYSWTMTANQADIISQYILKGGVVLAYSESTTGNTRLFQNLFNDINITSNTINPAGSLYKLPVIDDPILNGPFGDIRGKFWGEDASYTVRTVGLPLNDLIIYSYDADFNTANPTSTGAITSFRHKYFNLIWVGDGGFNSNCGVSGTICPFEVNSNNYPIRKEVYGHNTALSQPVYNSIFTANAIAWAIRQAEFNGINTQ